MAGLAAQSARAAAVANPLAPRAPHFPPKAKRVIFLFMQGGVSHVDSFDYKQRLIADHARAVDKPVAGLLTDLKARGLLEDTIVWWGGEFGRTPYAEKNGTGRDHNPGGFSVWLAGGGVKPGLAYEATDEFGHHAVEDKVHMHDLHATILHQLGLDHEKLNVDYVGSQTANSSGIPDQDHEGHGGWNIGQIDANIEAWFASFANPDVILLHIGTNDFGQNLDTVNAINRLDALITKMANLRPNAHIIVTNLMARNEPYNASIRSIPVKKLPSPP